MRKPPGKLEDLRCCAPHPDPRMWARGWNCNAKLTHAVAGTVALAPGEDPPPGSVALRCSRCGSRWIASPIDLAS